MATVECPSCKEKVIPRTWFHNMNSFIYKRKVEHICSLCGETMYFTGGGLNLISLAVPAGLIVGFAFLGFIGAALGGVGAAIL